MRFIDLPIAVNCGGLGGKPGPCPTFIDKPPTATGKAGGYTTVDKGGILKGIKDSGKVTSASDITNLPDVQLDKLAATVQPIKDAFAAGTKLLNEQFKVQNAYLDPLRKEYGIEIPPEYKLGGAQYGKGYPLDIAQKILAIPWQATAKAFVAAKADPYMKKLTASYKKWTKVNPASKFGGSAGESEEVPVKPAAKPVAVKPTIAKPVVKK